MPKRYLDTINSKVLEIRLRELVQCEVKSVSDLECWLEKERALVDEIQESITRHKIDFYLDTRDRKKYDEHLRDQTVIQPMLLTFQTELDAKFRSCPFARQLDERRYGAMKRMRIVNERRVPENSIELLVREKELGAKYSQIRGAMTVEWEGQTKPYSFAKAQLEHPHRTIREKAWHAMAEARRRVKPEIDEIMNELIKLRHQLALNAGFENYCDYMFAVKNREYTIQDCFDLHKSVEKHIVPAWNRLADEFRSELGVDIYRPWDNSAKMLHSIPFTTVDELLDGVQSMFEQTDLDFKETFIFMREHALLDVESRPGKRAGAFMDPLPATRDSFVFTNFSPSFDAIIALIHEMGHAIHIYLNGEFQEQYWRDEITELYAHGMELLILDKLDTFYPDSNEFKSAQREELRRALGLLMGPLTRDIFEYWMYTNPDHSAQERDRMFTIITKRFKDSPVNISGIESEVSTGWINTVHYFLHPFYAIEYSISEIGALQLLEIHHKDPTHAVALYKQGASTSFNHSIADIYKRTGIEFNFFDPIVKRTGVFLEQLLEEIR